MPTLLLIEDDTRLGELTKSFLTNQGFETYLAEDGHKGLRHLDRYDIDLVLLDLNLPDIDGITLCDQIRQRFNGAIIMLTARDSIMDEIIGLDAGADDYLKKPIEPTLLVSRVNAALRRQAARSRPSQELTIGRLTINAQTRTVNLNQQSVELGRLEFDILLYLCHNTDEIISRNIISQQTRGIEYDGVDRTIDIKISKLRKKLLGDTDNADLIKTIWGKGYLFNSHYWD